MPGTGPPEATRLDLRLRKWYIARRYAGDVVPALSCALRPRRRRPAPPPGHRRETCYRGRSRYGVGEGGRPGDKPSTQNVDTIDCHDVASVRASPSRRRVIGPGAAPALSANGLGGSPKCIRACRLGRRGSYSVLTLGKELGSVSGALESYYRYLIFQRTSYRLVDRHEDRVDMKNARDHKRGPGPALPTSSNH